MDAVELFLSPTYLHIDEIVEIERAWEDLLDNPYVTSDIPKAISSKQLEALIYNEIGNDGGNEFWVEIAYYSPYTKNNSLNHRANVLYLDSFGDVFCDESGLNWGSASVVIGRVPLDQLLELIRITQELPDGESIEPEFTKGVEASMLNEWHDIGVVAQLRKLHPEFDEISGDSLRARYKLLTPSEMFPEMPYVADCATVKDDRLEEKAAHIANGRE